MSFEPYTVSKILLKTSLYIESFVSDKIQPCCKTKVQYKLRQVLKISGSDTTALYLEDIEKERERSFMIAEATELNQLNYPLIRH